MHTAGREWEAVVAARNKVETAKATRPAQMQFIWSAGRDGPAPRDTAALSAAGKEAE